MAPSSFKHGVHSHAELRTAIAAELQARTMLRATKAAVALKTAAVRAYRNIRERFEVLTRGVRLVDAQHCVGSAWAMIIALFERKVPVYSASVKSIPIRIWSATPACHLACASRSAPCRVLLKDRG